MLSLLYIFLSHGYNEIMHNNVNEKFKEKYYDFAISDFDGTIFSSKNGINENTLIQIRKFVGAGGTFCICTGRMTSSILKFYKEFGFTGYVISFNGAEICLSATGEKIYKKHVDNQTCIRLLQYAEKNGRRIQVYPNDVLTVGNLNDDYRAYATRCHVDLCEVEGRVSDLFIKEEYTSGKVLFYTDDLSRGQMLREIREIIGDDYELICSNNEHIDVMAKGVSKGSAVRRLCEIIGKTNEKLICFGDEMNDLSMLREAGLGVATANGNDYLKSQADLVVASCEEGGVGEAMKRYCIG